MDSLLAMMRGEQNRGKEEMVFDWDKAAQLIKERGVTEAAAGLESDWEWTGGSIFQNNKPDTSSYTFLASTWATPELEIDGETIPCYKMSSETEGWGSDTKWPASALAILEGE